MEWTELDTAYLTIFGIHPDLPKPPAWRRAGSNILVAAPVLAEVINDGSTPCG